MSRLLIQMGALTRADVPALEIYCTLHGWWKEAEAHLAREGLTVRGGATGSVFIPSPYVRISNDCMKQMRAWMTELGITPSSRPQVTKVITKAQSGEDELDEYFFGRRN